MTVTLTADEVMARWRPGSHDTRPDGKPWTWGSEIVDLALRDADRLWWIAANYMHVPIVAGPDGRIWDGHHRVVVAARLGLPLLVDERAVLDGAPVDDQPPAREQRQLPHVGAEHGGLHPHGVDGRAAGVGGVDGVRDVVDDEGHRPTVERTFDGSE